MAWRLRSFRTRRLLVANFGWQPSCLLFRYARAHTKRATSSSRPSIPGWWLSCDLCNLTHLLKVLSPKIITLRIKTSTYKLRQTDAIQALIITQFGRELTTDLWSSSPQTFWHQRPISWKTFFCRLQVEEMAQRSRVTEIPHIHSSRQGLSSGENLMPLLI